MFQVGLEREKEIAESSFNSNVKISKRALVHITFVKNKYSNYVFCLTIQIRWQ